jgi:hypothetical protein
VVPRRRLPVTCVLVRHGSCSAWIGHKKVVVVPSVWCAQAQRGCRVLMLRLLRLCIAFLEPR